jgi:hypothetical protein
MKFTSAALALALSGSAIAGGADTVNAVLKEISDDLKSFDAAIKGWTSGEITTLDAASKKIQGATEGGASKISSGESLTLVDAAGITANVQGLQTQLDTTLKDLQSIGDKLASGGHCSNIQGQLKSQSSAASALQDAITGKAPPEAKSIAQQLGGQIGASIKETQAAFDKICQGAPSGGASGGSGSAPAGGSSGGAPKSGGSAPAGGAGGSGGSMAGHGNMGGSSSAPAGSGSKPATTTSAPKPATYAGAGSNIKVPFAVALALAVFAL